MERLRAKASKKQEEGPGHEPICACFLYDGVNQTSWGKCSVLTASAQCRPLQHSGCYCELTLPESGVLRLWWRRRGQMWPHAVKTPPGTRDWMGTWPRKALKGAGRRQMPGHSCGQVRLPLCPPAQLPEQLRAPSSPWPAENKALGKESQQ